MNPRLPAANLASRPYAYLLLMLCGLTWGLTFSMARIATSENAHPIGLAFWQAFGGALVLLVYCATRRRVPGFSRRSIVRYTIIGLIGTAIPGTLYYYAASRIPSGLLAITLTTVPMLTYAVSLMLGTDRYLHKRFAGLMAGFVAILILLVPESSLPEPSMTSWLLIALAASLFYTAENIYVDVVIPAGIDMVALLTGGLFAAALFLLPLVLAFDAWVSLDVPFTRVEWAIVGMAIVSSTAYAMFFLVVKMAGAVFASISAYIVTVSGVFWGLLFFREAHSLWVWSAFFLLLIGMALVTPREEVVSPDDVEHSADTGKDST